MSILEPSPSRPESPGPPSPANDRPRLITGGEVGSMEGQLGASGFDVVAVVDTEDTLMDAVATGDPDAIVVEADLCLSLERVRGLAPDAVLIVVGDHTPAGALGRIDRGVSGTVMAGLLHALVAEGAGTAVRGLVPRSPTRSRISLFSTSRGLLSDMVKLLRSHVASALRGHVRLAAAAGTLALAVSGGVLLSSRPPLEYERTQRTPASTLPMEPRPQRPTVSESSATRGPAPRPARNEAEWGVRRKPRSGTLVDSGRQSNPPSYHGSPTGDGPPPVTSGGSGPPGVANGWDHRPPRPDDNEHRNGWTNNQVPEDRASMPPEHETSDR